MSNLRKSLVRSVVAGSLVIAGGASATPQDEATPQKQMATRTGNGLVSSWKDLQASHLRVFHGNPANLEKMHFSAKQALHVKGTEKASDARETGKSDRAPKATASSPYRPATGYSAALSREQKFESTMRAERAAPKGSNEAVTDKAADEMGDIAPSGNDTGDKAQNVAAIAANHKFISNAFPSAPQQATSPQASVLTSKDGQLHLSPKQSQQLTQGDQSEMSTRNMASASNVKMPQEPMLGTHNNYADATDKVRYAQPVERMARIEMPAKFYR